MSIYFLESTAFAKLFVHETGSESLIRLLDGVEDNRKLIASSTPLELYAAIRRRERERGLTAEDAANIRESLRTEAARTVQQPLNPAVLEAARELIERTTLRWPDALQLGAAMTAREMFQTEEILFVSSLPGLLEAAGAEGFETYNPVAQE
ncbi:MAG: type II toxin-antitoxin system VapC family toxin [Terracidiphilus sp.]|nr:type II toxin-antitoxin system VapC family toxin [Terracidiphilus sp.]